MWQPIETANTAPYEAVDLWAVDRRTGQGRRYADAYRCGIHWLDRNGHFIAGKRFVDDKGDDRFDPNARDEQSAVITHWMPLPAAPK